MTQTFGILTSGGDSPGMNAALRAAVFAAQSRGLRLLGIQRGYHGLYHADWSELTPSVVENIHTHGGTCLRTARFAPFNNPAQRQAAIQQCLQNCNGVLSGLIVIGGDGSFRGARDLSLNGLPCVCLPGTIDNDIACTDYTIGYDTALNTVMHMADTIADTARSHERCMVLEVMGNKAGDLTLYGGIAAGATGILLMEFSGIEFPEQGELSSAAVEQITTVAIQRVNAAKAAGKTWFLLLVAEGITGKKDSEGRTRYPGGIEALTQRIQTATGIDCRCDVLAYMQRGGSPTARDRLLATQMGDYAVQLLSMGKSNRVVVVRQDQLTDYDIHEALQMPKQLRAEDYALAGRGSL